MKDELERPIDRLASSEALDALAGRIQPAVAAALVANSTLSDALHGTWLGHPVHPLVTDVPVGAWTLAVAFDTLTLFGVEGFERAADASIAIGLAGACGAALTGLADWSDTDGDAKRVGMAHALLNGAAGVLYASSLGLRSSGRRRGGIAAALAGYALTSAAAYLGGELSFDYGVGVRQTDTPRELPRKFTRVCALGDLVRDGATRVHFENVPVLVSLRGDEVRAVAATCTHRGGPLDERRFTGDCVTCPWHGSVFNVRDGSVVRGPAVYALATFEARLSGDDVELRSVPPAP